MLRAFRRQTDKPVLEGSEAPADFLGGRRPSVASGDDDAVRPSSSASLIAVFRRLGEEFETPEVPLGLGGAIFSLRRRMSARPSVHGGGPHKLVFDNNERSHSPLLVWGWHC
ncbi:hypothetical protein ACRAWF_28150 [Streptomyces sp. L7]